MRNPTALQELSEQIAADADKLAASMPPTMASLAVLGISETIVKHLYDYGERLPAQTLATLSLAAAMLYHCSRLFPPEANIDGSSLPPLNDED